MERREMKIQGGGGREGRIGKEGGERKVGRRRGDEEREEDGGKIVRMQGGRWGGRNVIGYLHCLRVCCFDHAVSLGWEGQESLASNLASENQNVSLQASHVLHQVL